MHEANLPDDIELPNDIAPPGDTPEAARAYIHRNIIRSLPAIVAGFLEAAQTGSASHLKLIFDLLRTPPAEPTPQPQQSSAAILLEELRRRCAATNTENPERI